MRPQTTPAGNVKNALAWSATTCLGIGWNTLGFGIACIPLGAVTNLTRRLFMSRSSLPCFEWLDRYAAKQPLYALAGVWRWPVCSLVNHAAWTLKAHISPPQIVLRSQFWLWHVKTIVASYAMFFLAWAMATIVLLQCRLARRQPVLTAAGHSIYRVLQRRFLIIAGTLLGAVWADQAWGRFWGWDPKEVWVLVVILIYLIPLHLQLSRPGVRHRLAAWSVYGFGSVIFSWYGAHSHPRRWPAQLANELASVR